MTNALLVYASIENLPYGIMSTLLAMVIAFALITLTASYFRFQKIIELAEETQPEEMGSSNEDILRIQLARYLAGCARRNTSFCMSLIQTNGEMLPVRMGSPFITALKKSIRKSDITCIYDEHTAAVLTESDPDHSQEMLTRVLSALREQLPESQGEPLKASIASYPGHALSGKELVRIGLEALEQSTTENPITLPEIIDYDNDEDEDEVADTNHADGILEEIQTKPKRGDSILDPLTGVLKPTVVSTYMQRMFGEFRRKKLPLALFSIGVNNMGSITKFHGSNCAEDVLVTVSDILQQNLRQNDLIGRHEKSAFLVLTQVPLAQAEFIGKRLSTLIQQSETITEGKRLKTSISIGVAGFPEHGKNIHQLYRAAQKVLDYNRTNDIRAYAVYDPKIHDAAPAKPMRNIKSVQA